MSATDRAVASVIRTGLAEAGVSERVFAWRIGVTASVALRKLAGGRITYPEMVTAAELIGVRPRVLCERIERALTGGEAAVHEGSRHREAQAARQRCDALTAPVLHLRPGLLSDLGEPDATALAARIGWDDVAGLRRALDGEACSVALLCSLVLAYLPTPMAYFATTADSDASGTEPTSSARREELRSVS